MLYFSDVSDVLLQSIFKSFNSVYFFYYTKYNNDKTQQAILYIKPNYQKPKQKNVSYEFETYY